MIVKNESKVLARCLDSLEGLMDEIIIVDTGSTDDTKEIAARYTDKIYDFQWVDDFAAARNYSFSLATMDYIYAPDADEVLDDYNRDKFMQLKQSLSPEIEIVQMQYTTAGECETVLNSSTELRPKLFKRLRPFVWIDPVHETVRLDPVVYDSDIEIMHMPVGVHGTRDFRIFEKTLENMGTLSPKLTNMYARELLKVGTKENIETAESFFRFNYELGENDARVQAACVLARLYRLENNVNEFFKIALVDMAGGTPCSEICCELGTYFEDCDDIDEAIMWYQNASSQTEPVLDVNLGARVPLEGLKRLLTQKMEQAVNECDSLAEMECSQALESIDTRLANLELVGM